MIEQQEEEQQEQQHKADNQSNAKVVTLKSTNKRESSLSKPPPPPSSTNPFDDDYVYACQYHHHNNDKHGNNQQDICLPTVDVLLAVQASQQIGNERVRANDKTRIKKSSLQDEEGVSFDDDDDDDDDNNNDDDSFLSFEPEIRHESSYADDIKSSTEDSKKHDSRHKELSGDGIHIHTDEDKKHSKTMGNKRIAPLSFDIQQVTATPALDFSTTNHSVQDNLDFVSPLETALIDQVDHLKSNNYNDKNNSGDDCENRDDNNNNLKESSSSSSVPSLITSPSKYLTGVTTRLSKYLYSSEQSNNNISVDHDHKDGDNHGDHHLHYDEDHDKNLKVERIHNMATKEAPSSTDGNPTSTADNNNEIQIKAQTNPLIEAQSVMQRMDTVSKSLTHLLQKAERNEDTTARATSHHQKEGKTNSTNRNDNKRSSLNNQEQYKNRYSTTSLIEDGILNNKLLQKIDCHRKDTDFTFNHKHTGTPWTRLIILEELGTASSWIVLLLPYVAFLIAVVLDSSSRLWDITSKPLYAHDQCLSGYNIGTATSTPTSIDSIIPISPLPNKPCWYNYHIQNKNNEEEGGVVVNRLNAFLQQYDDGAEYSFKRTMTKGVAITSGPLVHIPVLSSYLYADIGFDNLPQSSVSLISKGAVFTSSIVMQKRPQKLSTQHDQSFYVGNSDNIAEWFPVYVSDPVQLSLVCNRADDGNQSKSSSKFNCNSPRSVNLLFTQEAATYLAGGTVRIDTLFSHGRHKGSKSLSLFSESNKDPSLFSNTTNYATDSTIISGHVEDKEVLKNADIADTETLLDEIVKSSSFYVSHQRVVSGVVLVGVRIVLIVLTISFLIFWLWSIGINGFFGVNSGACCCKVVNSCHTSGSNDSSSFSHCCWWENPWILFPERRYLLLMILSLLLVQNPVMIYAYFHPFSFEDKKLSLIADTCNGLGIHAILALWLCLLHGLRYHTAEMTRKRAENKRRQVELWNTINYLGSSTASIYNQDQSSLNHLQEYYDKYGDADGIGDSWITLRMKHDPCGDNWPDFLIPKVMLFALSAGAVFLTAQYKYHDKAILESHTLHRYHLMYMLSSFLHIALLALWVTLIFRAAFKTGQLLRKEPFLSTRPAQLVYRILMNIIISAAMSSFILFMADFFSLAKEWESNQHFKQTGSEQVYGLFHRSSTEFSRSSNNYSILVNMFFKLILYAKQRIPYAGAAIGLGSGEILFISICTLTVAFVFLPSTDFILNLGHSYVVDNMGDGTFIQAENQRRDKRTLVTLSRYTHTWRVFPSPIERYQKHLSKQLQSVDHYEINKYFRMIKNQWGPGTIYKNNYVAVFCIETALWLLECCWQTYYSATEYKTDDFAPGMMNLESVGLRLEKDIFHEETDTRAFVATNISPQIDGNDDSIIVVAFRGTASTTNLKTDFDFEQDLLPDTFMTGSNIQAEFEFEIDGGIAQNDNEYGATHISSVTLVRNNKSNKRRSRGRTKKNLLKAAPIARQAFPCVHKGFSHAYSKIREEIMEAVVQVYERQLVKAVERCNDENALKLPKIWVTGHSMGGALSQLFALDLACNIEVTNDVYRSVRFHKRSQSYDPQPKGNHYEETEMLVGPGQRLRSSSLPHYSNIDIKFGLCQTIEEQMIEKRCLRVPIALYSFGQPRIGNHAFAKLYKLNVPHSFRVVTEGDIVTSLPFASWHAGISLYKHAGLEVVLDEGGTGNILVGPTVVETKFRFSKFRTSLNAHPIDNYRHCIEAAFTRKELQEFYSTKCRFDRSFRNGYNQSDILPDWVTDVSLTNSQKEREAIINLPDDWIHPSEDSTSNMHRSDLPDWVL